jgi:hypothetical protein
VTSHDFKVLLEFIYSGRLTVNIQNVWNISNAATILELPDAVKLCHDFVDIMSGIPVYKNPPMQQQQPLGHSMASGVGGHTQMMGGAGHVIAPVPIATEPQPPPQPVLVSPQVSGREVNFYP